MRLFEIAISIARLKHYIIDRHVIDKYIIDNSIGKQESLLQFFIDNNIYKLFKAKKLYKSIAKAICSAMAN